MVAATHIHPNMFIIWLLFFVQWCYICWTKHLREPILEKPVMLWGFYRSVLVPAVAVVCAILGFF
jgi:hypothetical protein